MNKTVGRAERGNNLNFPLSALPFLFSIPLSCVVDDGKHRFLHVGRSFKSIETILLCLIGYKVNTKS